MEYAMKSASAPDLGSTLLPLGSTFGESWWKLEVFLSYLFSTEFEIPNEHHFTSLIKFTENHWPFFIDTSDYSIVMRVKDVCIGRLGGNNCYGMYFCSPRKGNCIGVKSPFGIRKNLNFVITGGGSPREMSAILALGIEKLNKILSDERRSSGIKTGQKVKDILVDKVSPCNALNLAHNTFIAIAGEVDTQSCAEGGLKSEIIVKPNRLFPVTDEEGYNWQSVIQIVEIPWTRGYFEAFGLDVDIQLRDDLYITISNKQK
jgi:hypothetical protein